MLVLSDGSPAAKEALSDLPELQKHPFKSNKRIYLEGVPITMPEDSNVHKAASGSQGGLVPFSKKHKTSRPSFTGPPVEDDPIEPALTAQSSLSFSEKMAQAKAMSTKRSQSDGEKRAAASLTSLIPKSFIDQAKAAAAYADTHELLLSAACLIIMSQTKANTDGQMDMVGELNRISQEQTLKANMLERENAQLKALLGAERESD